MWVLLSNQLQMEHFSIETFIEEITRVVSEKIWFDVLEMPKKFSFWHSQPILFGKMETELKAF